MRNHQKVTFIIPDLAETKYLFKEYKLLSNLNHSNVSLTIEINMYYMLLTYKTRQE